MLSAVAATSLQSRLDICMNKLHFFDAVRNTTLISGGELNSNTHRYVDFSLGLDVAR